VIQVNADGENAIFTFGGANRQLTSDDVDRAFELCSSHDLLLIQNETNQLDYILSRLKGADLRVAFNAAPVDEKLMEYDLSNIDVLIVNEVEAAALSDTPDPTNALQNLCVRYPQCDVVLSLGKGGLLYGRGGKRLRLKAFTVQAVDETAAGDSFVGYFVAAILRGLPCDDALLYGSAAGALAVTLPGAASSIPEATAVESLISTDDLTI
jgi:ribokinase